VTLTGKLVVPCTVAGKFTVPGTNVIAGAGAGPQLLSLKAEWIAGFQARCQPR